MHGAEQADAVVHAAVRLHALKQLLGVVEDLGKGQCIKCDDGVKTFLLRMGKVKVTQL